MLKEKESAQAEITAISQRFERAATTLKLMVEEHERSLSELREMQRICKAASEISKSTRFFPERKRVKTVQDVNRLPALSTEISASFEREQQLCKQLETIFADFAPQVLSKGKDVGMEVA
ncbi:Uncharacterised protein [uncultured archaeon]|nr:Uncharacterised protein [uncultured archaeon]